MNHIVKILSERERKQHIEWRREFWLIGDYPGNGASFPCDSHGNLCMDDEYVDIWYPNYEDCLAYPEKYEDQGVVKNSWWYTEPTHARCSCGAEVILQGDTVCECGQWYNGFGQALLDPEYWEEDYYDDEY